MEIIVEIMFGVLGAVLVVALGLWLGKRQFESTVDPELLEAMRLEKSDPARAEFLADKYFTRGVAREELERKELWALAPNDMGAAQELRRRLVGDLAADAEIQLDTGKSGNAGLGRTLEESQQRTREQIAKLDEIMSRTQAI